MPTDVTLFGQRRGSGESIWEIKRQIGWVAPELHLYYPRGFSCFDVVCSGFFDSVGLLSAPIAAAARQRAGAGWSDLGYLQLAAGAFWLRSLRGSSAWSCIARALVKEPALLVLDEPCQGLDAANRDRVLQTVEAIGDRCWMQHDLCDARSDALPRIITHALTSWRAGRVVSLQVRSE